MRLSKLHLRTLREVPNDAEVPSHILLQRAGMIKKIVSGMYGFMFLGYRSIRKIAEIVRQEMDSAGAQEQSMPVANPGELWQESGRWYAYGPELWRFKDRSGRDFCLAPTCEEVFTDIVRNEVSSYRQLPINLYHIQYKYRDEARPRFGLMRCREFIMKDAYSFDKDAEGLDNSYRQMYEAYTKIFERCGLTFRVVEADNGPIGGSNSHEFMVLSEVGESEVAYCDQCNLAATSERAECTDDPHDEAEMLEMEEVHTPNTKTIEEVAAFLSIPTNRTLKALLFVKYNNEWKEDGYVAAFIRGDRELNKIKLVNALAIPEFALEFADEVKMGGETGSVGGFTGPVGLKNCVIVVDSEVVGMKNLCAGANKHDYHVKNVNYGRDYKGDIIADIKLLRAGEPCPKCGNPVRYARGIEVGHIFKLGTKYSELMGAYYKDENMQDQLIVMGCYGVGVSRTLAAVVEQCHDDDGIIWPVSVAPFHAIVTIVNYGDKKQEEIAEEIYNELRAAGVETLLDDRDERAGVKFKDADLIGIPVRINVGKKAGDGIVEYKLRREKKMDEVDKEEAVRRVVRLVDEEGQGLRL